MNGGGVAERETTTRLLGGRRGRDHTWVADWTRVTLARVARLADFPHQSVATVGRLGGGRDNRTQSGNREPCPVLEVRSPRCDLRGACCVLPITGWSPQRRLCSHWTGRCERPVSPCVVDQDQCETFKFTERLKGEEPERGVGSASRLERVCSIPADWRILLGTLLEE